MKVLEVSQFFEYENMTWKELTETKEKPVLLSEDKTTCLWTETPKLKEVTEKDNCRIGGNVWLKKGKNGKVELYKYNYDSSD